jgi:hypothetical protein
MRLKSEIWVQAYLRICASAGVAAVLVRRGDADAGAIYIRVNRLDGTSDLYGPAPAGGYGLETDRRWVRCLGDAPRPDGEVDSYLASQRKFDTDLWVIEAEDRQGRHFLDDWLATG